MAFLRVPSVRVSYNFFDCNSGHLYYHNVTKEEHECVYDAFGEYFNLPKFKFVQCTATFESLDDHCHPPHPRHVLEKILLLWKSRLCIISQAGFLNGSCGFWTTSYQWK